MCYAMFVLFLCFVVIYYRSVPSIIIAIYKRVNVLRHIGQNLKAIQSFTSYRRFKSLKQITK